MLILSKIRILGHSMEPNFKNNDLVLASSIPFIIKNPRIGDAVLFRCNGETLVKRIVKIENNKYYLEGDNKSDSLEIKPIERKDILGKVIIKI